MKCSTCCTSFIVTFHPCNISVLAALYIPPPHVICHLIASHHASHIQPAAPFVFLLCVRMIPLILYYRYFGSRNTSCVRLDPIHYRSPGVTPEACLGFPPRVTLGSLTGLLVVRPRVSTQPPRPRVSRGCPLYIHTVTTQYNHPILTAYTFLHGIMSFSHFCSSLGLTSALPLFRVDDDDARLAATKAATALQQCITNEWPPFRPLRRRLPRLVLASVSSSFSSTIPRTTKGIATLIFPLIAT
jgi:hypothetical protein